MTPSQEIPHFNLWERRQSRLPGNDMALPLP